ncbi:putative ubiquitin hydrolase [Talaromyces proteolyticus]|uniref:Ubiquitin hydrolase n=1 Tax=Talaromyces proteolyticus TaxID=1131652 RepID=A0AAD4PZ34_9EURO|nr:putative ubiquitin hydrolase [Talaromyces proteolyticus]KAH8696007.1 putative ubiquitin hydrolase [Talaromyces proteolyticus]
MAGTPLGSSSTSTPPGAVSPEGSLRAHDDYLEDTDSQTTRKRPRLDPDPDSLPREAMSTGPPPTTPTREELPSLQPSSSQVTINMKSPSQAIPSPQEQFPANEISKPEDEIHSEVANDQISIGEDTAMAGAHSSTAISISSSPAHSPEIEVADLEDMDQDPNTSQWRPLGEALREQHSAGIVQVHEPFSLADQFPKLRGNPDLRESLEETVNMIEKGHPQDTMIFNAVKQWVSLCADNLSQITLDTIQDDREFWEELPTLVEGLLRRAVNFQTSQGQGTWQYLEEFFFDFGNIAIHMLCLDISYLTLLSQDQDIQLPDSICRPYLQSLVWTLQVSNIPFYRALTRLNHSKVANLVARINDHISDAPVNALEHLSEYVSLIFDQLTRFPQLASALVPALAVASNMLESRNERRTHGADEDLLETPAVNRIVKYSYGLFRVVNEKYQNAVAKKASWVTSDVSDNLSRSIGVAFRLFCDWDVAFATKLAEDLSLDLPDVANEDYALIVYYAWKFASLKRHIMDGRMELRVWGVESMQAELISIWRQNIQGNPEGIEYPIVQYLLKFLRDIRIIDYIVGVGSHPQLISRSGNIVGFFVVTGTYTNTDTDTIWKAVTDSQDQRTIGEVLTMLGRTITMHPSSSTSLLYFSSKLLELPLNRFDTRVVEFCDLLFKTMREKYEERHRDDFSDSAYLDSTPLRLCVRLIRESNSCHDISDEHKVTLQRFAGVQLQQFLLFGMSEPDKRDVYERCIGDIGEKNEFASGSIQALNALIPMNFDTQEIRKLATDYDLTALVISEFAHFWENITELADRFSQNALSSRVHLLGRIIDKVPDTITEELSDLLWTRVFMTGNLDQARGFVWEMLCRAMKHCIAPNPFVDRCLHHYLPEVSPENYSSEIVSFAEHAVHYEIRFNPPPVANENEIIALPGMERIWHFILTAPPNTIEGRATQFAIEIYLDHLLIRRAPASAAEATHISLVDRCVEQIKSAATKLKSFNDSADGEDKMMVTTADEQEIQSAGLKLSRSLLFLQQLLQGLRSRPQYSPPQGPPPELPERIGRGEPVDISYQSFNESNHSKIRTLRIGNLCTAAELVDRLTRVTGFSKFSVIYGGQKIDLLETPNTTVRDLNIKALLIIRKIPDGPGFMTAGRRQSLTLVDSEVLKHFDDLYDLLDLEDSYAREIYDFLIVFPPQERLRGLVRAETNGEEKLFPMEKPYKFLYSVKALSICLREESLEGEPNSSFLRHSIQILINALIRPQMAAASKHNMNLVFACHLIECLLLCLSVKTTSSHTIPNAEALVKELLFFIEACQKMDQSEFSETDIQKVICNSFAVLVEASVSHHGFWEVTKKHAQFDLLIFSLLLEEKRHTIRRQIAEKIKIVCGPPKPQKKNDGTGTTDADGSSPSETPVVLDIMATIWDAFVQNMRRSVQYADQSQEFFAVALVVFHSVSEKSPHDVIFTEYVSQWSDAMLSHKTQEFVGREPVDHVILGFARLLRWCLDVAEQTNTKLNATSLIESLINNYLFPDLSEPSDTEIITPRIPVMHGETREELYNILVLLCKQADNYAKVIDLMSDLIPHDYTYNTTWAADRLKAIRSPEGYAGLKNLSNTCYLNSLFTQLFMNISFREFMLNVSLTEPESQRLLVETKKIFGNMQETWCRYVDPEGAVGCIRTYDNEPIDVTIQMDVDEFYNLLFDRWEAQILDPEDKKRFRTFYGGQLVQQIKSKECEHISERLEPFSAIQCDIKGKANLEESLQAYVEGEVMQGDNKYSCTSCEKHVDAVKRACLKDVPDNLIFHLKRFDFDMLTMMRSKINDEFQFPERIDMTPYKVEFLSDPDNQLEPDIFELVGVLVHSGTAESGHYYSYIRERPVADSKKSWVEFNDADVSSFEPAKIAEQCFGGLNESFHATSMGQGRFGKVWNAYMLFYQRVTSMETAKEIYQPTIKDTPVHVKLPIDLGNHIAMENELFIRTYCLLDPYHASFVRYLLHLSNDFVSSGKPDFSRLQKTAIFIAMDTFDQLISRCRELPELDRVFPEFNKAIYDTPKGALRVIQWINERDTGLRNLILKPTQPAVRNISKKIFVSALARLQDLAGNNGMDEIDQAKWELRYTESWDQIVIAMSNLWPILHIASRSWDDYFELLSLFTSFQNPKIDILLDNGFLLKCLEIIWLDREDSKDLRRHYLNYFRLVERGRKFSHRKLMELLTNLLKFIDFTLPPTPDDRVRLVKNGRYSLSETESCFIFDLGQGKTKELVLVRKILQHQVNPPASHSIVGQLLEAEPQLQKSQYIIKVLEDGLRVAPAQLCAPFLEAATVFCMKSPDEEQVINLIDYVAKGVESINNSGGREHITFFTNIVTCRNERIEKDERWFSEKVLVRIPDWAPTLLIYPEKTVKDITFDMLRELLLNQEQNENDEEYNTSLHRVARELAEGCIDRLRKTYLVQPGQNVEAKVVDTITFVITHCLREYFDEGEPEDAEFMQQAEAVLSAIDQLSVDVPEEMASEDWEDQSIMGSDSELGMATP